LARAQRQQQVDLLIAADQPGQRRPPQCLEPALHLAGPYHLPSLHRFRKTLKRHRAEIAVFENPAGEPARFGRDDKRAGVGEGLKPGREVGRLANDIAFPRRALADHVADHDQPGGDTDPYLRPEAGSRVQTGNRFEDRKPGMDRTDRIILMRLWVAEISEHTVAHVLGEIPTKANDALGTGRMVGVDQIAQILGVDLRR
jgi:hypothetical protein